VDVEGQRKPWYRKTRYIILLGILAALLLFSFLGSGITPPKSSNQSRLDRTINYFALNYSPTTGLITETPHGTTYWLYSDNYLATLAIQRYNPNNSTTSSFAPALDAALGSYLATLPSGFEVSQYTALNSTSASFSCSDNYTLGWTSGAKSVTGPTPATMMTTVNDGSPSCSSQNYADILFLQALWFNRFGNSTAAASYYNKAASDFDGKGFVDLAYDGTVYQTYKLALYVYASSCLGQTSGSNYSTATKLLYSMQDNSTGGFYTGYNAQLSHSNTSVNTETTALAALALEQLIHPSSGC
jgi:hypothetical protein